MGLIGGAVGGLLGSVAGGYFGDQYRDHGRNIGAAIGALSPYKTGGVVKGRYNKPIPIIAHGGEYIIPTKFVKQIPAKLKSKILKNKKKHRK